MDTRSSPRKKLISKRRHSDAQTTEVDEQLTLSEDSEEDDTQIKRPTRKRRPSSPSKPQGENQNTTFIPPLSRRKPGSSSVISKPKSMTALITAKNFGGPSASPRPRPQPIPPADAKSNASELSDLSLLSSPSSSTFVGNNPVSRSGPAERTPLKSQPSSSTLLSQYITSSSQHNSWNVSRLQGHVWVLIEDKSGRVFNTERNNVGKEFVWWPGKVKGSPTQLPLKVNLFNATQATVTIPDPCEQNILPKCDTNGQIHFDAPKFLTPSDILASPRKKQRKDKGGIEKRWEEAFQEMLFDSEDDDLPSIETAFDSNNMHANRVTTSTSSGKGKGKAKSYLSSGSNSEVELDDWEPLPPDEELTIPGELVLARHKQKEIFWPAKIMGYIPPKNSKKDGTYITKYLDGIQKDIPRSWFFAVTQDEFATCNLGKFQSSYDDIGNDNDDLDCSSTNNPGAPRSPSPVITSPPTSLLEYSNQGIRHQFGYTKPILRAILNDEYPPAQRKHNRFIAGGSHRKGVVEEAGLRGVLSPAEVNELQECLREWCLRDEIRAIQVEDGDDQKNTTVSGEPINDLVADEIDITNDAKTLHALSPALTLVDFAMTSSPQEPPPDSSFSSIVPLEHELPNALASQGSSCSGGSVAAEPTTVEDDMLSSSAPGSSWQNKSCRPTRQYGCKAYEALSRLEKNDYCLNVLLPEAILQILLWRSGDRTSVELMSLENEQLLHEKGEELMHETDFVFDVLRMRKSKRRKLGLDKISQGNNAVFRRRNSDLGLRKNVRMLNYKE